MSKKKRINGKKQNGNRDPQEYLETEGKGGVLKRDIGGDGRIGRSGMGSMVRLNEKEEHVIQARSSRGGGGGEDKKKRRKRRRWKTLTGGEGRGWGKGGGGGGVFEQRKIVDKGHSDKCGTLCYGSEGGIVGRWGTVRAGYGQNEKEGSVIGKPGPRGGKT